MPPPLPLLLDLCPLGNVAFGDSVDDTAREASFEVHGLDIEGSADESYKYSGHGRGNSFGSWTARGARWQRH